VYKDVKPIDAAHSMCQSKNSSAPIQMFCFLRVFVMANSNVKTQGALYTPYFLV